MNAAALRKQLQRRRAGVRERVLQPEYKPQLWQRQQCALCGTLCTFPAAQRSPWACALCVRDYVRFRRAFKAENGHYPTIDQFRDDEV